MSFDNIKLEKGLYTTGKSFTSALEELDPSENYIGTSLEGLDAYERQLKRFDIKVSGVDSDPVSKFFATTDSAALFPEYIARAVKIGVERNSIVDEIIATTTEIDSLDYRSIKTNIPNEDVYLDNVAEGGSIPELTITLDEKLTKMKKNGKMLVASYEAIKFQKLDLFTTVLKQIGNHIAIQEFEEALSVVFSDDNNYKCIKTNTNDFVYGDYVKLWAELTPFNMTTIVVNKDTLAKMLMLPEFKDSNAGLDFHGTGNLITPFGTKVIVSDILDNGSVIGLDKNYSIEKVQSGGIITEFDKLIDRQLERATISTITGYSVIYSDAIGIISAMN